MIGNIFGGRKSSGAGANCRWLRRRGVAQRRTDAAPPEWAVRPALFKPVIMIQCSSVGGEFARHKGAKAGERCLAAAAQPVGNGIGRKDTAAQRLEYSLTRDRVEARGRVADA